MTKDRSNSRTASIHVNVGPNGSPSTRTGEPQGATASSDVHANIIRLLRTPIDITVDGDHGTSLNDGINLRNTLMSQG